MNNIIEFKFYTKSKERMLMSITKERMLEIERVTSSLLQNVNFDDSPSVDIVSIVKKDHFEVKPKSMDIETTGLLLVNDDEPDNNRLIYVNTKFKNPDNEEDVVFKKSRFITAHEYGHFILHKEDGVPIYAHRDTYHRTEPIELEADYFARSILMPLKLFEAYYEVSKKICKNDEDFILEVLSAFFKVTKNKIRKRMEDLLVLNQ